MLLPDLQEDIRKPGLWSVETTAPGCIWKGRNMEKLIYSIADLSICIETPHPLEISEESDPFLKSEEADCDGQITLVPVDSLQAMEGNGVWHQDRYYTCTEEGDICHIRSVPGAPPYAMIAYKANHHICISYLRGSKDMIFQSRYLLNMLGLEQLLLTYNALILHSSFIRWQGHGILFSAPPGTGKSTQASLWESHMGADILNGDRAGIRHVNGTWYAYGLPYAGSSRIYRNECAPIRTIVVLRQGPENVIRPMPLIPALRALLPEFSAQRWNSSFMNKMLDIAVDLLQEIPVYCLECRPDYEAVQLLYNTLTKEGIIC